LTIYSEKKSFFRKKYRHFSTFELHKCVQSIENKNEKAKIIFQILSSKGFYIVLSKMVNNYNL